MPLPEMQRLQPFGISLKSQRTLLKHEEGAVAAGECSPQAVGQSSSRPSSELLHFEFSAPDVLCLLTGC